MLRTVISGGQTGVDQAALEAAQRAGIATGGWMPKGFRTTKGNESDVAKKYGLLEHESAAYPPRTEANVVWGDATIRFASNFFSPGEKLTHLLVARNNKPLLDLDPSDLPPPEKVAEWIDRWAEVLNVAGNSETTSPGIGILALLYLEGVFKLCKTKGEVD